MVKVTSTAVNGKPASERYSAPALEKGLDLLEILADEAGALTQKQLAERAGRSIGEIFRMLGVLERRGYLVRDGLTGRYSLTLKLFVLGNRHQPTRRLQAAALPVMQDLAEAVGQSCHLVVATEDRMTVVAQAEPRGPMVFTVKQGADFPLSAHRVSARVLAAFASRGRQDEMLQAMIVEDRAPDSSTLRKRLNRIAREGYDMVPSETIGGVIDLAFPVFDQDGYAKASLVVPLLPVIGRTPETETVKAKVAEAAQRISAAIGGVAAES
ncbi:MAG TPA: IclR family transcriptional regulator [Roseiarcus sp.]